MQAGALYRMQLKAAVLDKSVCFLCEQYTNTSAAISVCKHPMQITAWRGPMGPHA